MGIDVREAEIGDIPHIVEVWQEFMIMLRRTNPHYWKVKNGRSAFTKYLEDVLAQTEVLVAIAERDKKLIGFCLAHIETLPEWFGSNRIGLIRYLAVSEGNRGRGVGNQITTFVKDWFFSFEIKRIELYVLKGLPASKFWTKLGFIEFMDRRFLEENCTF